MGHLFPRDSRISMPVAVAAEGCYITDKSGKRYLDGSCGAAVSCLGHGDREVTAAIKAQLDRLDFAHTSFFTSEPAEAVAELLAAHAPGELSRVYFLSGGSEAMEAALKLARQYAVESGQPARARVIARHQSYHGNTLGALAVGGHAGRRKLYGPLLFDVSHIAACHPYRGRREGESAEDYGLRVADELEAEILARGPETVLAFVAETVVGSTLGAVPATPGYFRRIREICDRYGVLLILDEVMCGMGRTGTLFACEQEGVAPDICAIAKGLGGGYQPIGATLATERIYRTIAEGSGAFEHGHTYVGHPVAAAAAEAVLKKLTGGLVAQVPGRGARLAEALEAAFGQHPHVGDIRGRGLFQAIEIVEDRETKRPFPAERGVARAVKAAALEEGLICYPSGGSADGRAGDHVLLAPPFVISDAEIDELADKLSRALDRVIG